MQNSRRQRLVYHRRLSAACDALEDRRLLSAGPAVSNAALSATAILARKRGEDDLWCSAASQARLASAISDTTYSTTITPLDPVAANLTGDKPQSKVWTYDNRWFGVFANSEGTHVWRLDSLTWTKVLTLSTNDNFKADVKPVGDVAHVLLYGGASSKLASIQYNSATFSWEFWSQRPGLTNVTFSSGVETATIDLDSNGRMWAASDGSTTIEVRYSDAPYTSFSAKITIATGVGKDDISTIIALPNQTIGLMWSNQTTKRFGFRVHQDHDEPSVWLVDEVPGAAVAQNVGHGMADDHLNLSVATDGTLYAAVKTSYDSSGSTTLGLLVRRPSGVWDDALYPITTHSGTRPVVALNEPQGRIVVAYRTTNSNGPIVYKDSPTASISFGTEKVLIDGTELNDVTGAKQNFTTDTVFISSGPQQGTGISYVRSALFTSTISFNTAPLVNAGPDLTIVEGNLVALDGNVIDDGLPSPPGAIASNWSKISGAGVVTFGNALAIDTMATFSTPGAYVLQLAARDGEATVWDDVTVTVEPRPPVGFVISAINPAETNTTTEDRPQSKVWTYDGRWFSVFTDPVGTHVWRLDGLAWTKVLTLSDIRSFRADVKPVGNLAHILLFTPGGSKLASVQYVPATDSWEFWSQRPGLTNVAFSTGVDTAAIDIDSTGRMWAVSDGTTTIEARYSEAPYTSFSPPITIATGVDTDDIAAVVALPNRTLGVMWSNQVTKRFGFRTHQDLAAPDQWSADEVPGGSAALNVGSGMAKDQVSLAVASDGTLYAAIKTKYEKSGHTSIGLLVRRPSGLWDAGLYPVTIKTGVRPVVVLDEIHGRIVVAYRVDKNFGPIVYKDSPTSSISFGPHQTLIDAAEINDVSTTKQTFTHDVVFIAGGTDPANGKKYIKGAVLTNPVEALPNQPPLVDAGLEQTIAQNAAATLDATVTDDGLPSPPATITVNWSMVDGPGIVTFANAAAVDTAAIFTAPGTYVLRLDAYDGEFTTHDEVTVTVTVGSAPTVSAGPNLAIAIFQSAVLDGTVSDDGLPNPPGHVTTQWTAVSGPGVVTFADATAVDTTATFSATGTYVLRLTASDGEAAASADMTVDVSPPPTVTVAFQQGVSPTASYAGTTDTYLRADDPTKNFGGKNALLTDGVVDIAALLRWDLTSIPMGSRVQSVTLRVYVNDKTVDTFEIYEVKHSWVENQANWNVAAAGSNWQSAGAQGTDTSNPAIRPDRGTSVLGVLTSAGTALKTFDFNVDGIDAVQRWIDDPTKNFGITVQDYLATDLFEFSSKEATNIPKRPTLTITYQLPLGGLPAPSAMGVAAPDPMDVSGDSAVTPLDALMVINALNGVSNGATMLASAGSGSIDVNGDGFVTPLDALLIINRLNGASSLNQVAATLGVDTVLPLFSVRTGSVSVSDSIPLALAIDSAVSSLVEHETLRPTHTWLDVDEPVTSRATFRSTQFGEQTVAASGSQARLHEKTDVQPIDAVFGGDNRDWEAKLSQRPALASSGHQDNVFLTTATVDAQVASAALNTTASRTVRRDKRLHRMIQKFTP